MPPDPEIHPVLKYYRLHWAVMTILQCNPNNSGFLPACIIFAWKDQQLKYTGIANFHLSFYYSSSYYSSSWTFGFKSAVCPEIIHKLRMNKVIESILASLPCSCCDHMQSLKGFLLLLSFFKQVYCCLPISVLSNRWQLLHLVCLGISRDGFLFAQGVRCQNTH